MGQQKRVQCIAMCDRISDDFSGMGIVIARASGRLPALIAHVLPASGRASAAASGWAGDPWSDAAALGLPLAL